MEKGKTDWLERLKTAQSTIPGEITISIDCFQCGTKLEIPYKLWLTCSEYCYCPDCQEGIEIRFDGEILHINRLDALASA